MDRDATARHQNVCAREAAFFTEREGRPFVDQVAAGQLVTAHAGIREQGARTPFDIDPTVNACCTRVGGDGIQGFFVFPEVFSQRFQALRPLLEVQLQQVR